MSKVLVVFFMVNCLCSLKSQHIYTSHESGLVAYGTTIEIAGDPGDTILYAFGGNKPGDDSPYFVGSVNMKIPIPNELEPIWAHINTLVSDPDDLPVRKQRFLTQPNTVFESIDSVGKCAVIWLIKKGCSDDSCQRILQYFDPVELNHRHGSIPVVSLVADPEELYGKAGILVEGDTCFQPLGSDTLPISGEFFLFDKDCGLVKKGIDSIVVVDFKIGVMPVDSMIILLKDSIAMAYGKHFNGKLIDVKVVVYEKAFEVAYSSMTHPLKNYFTYTNEEGSPRACPPIFSIRDDVFDFFPDLPLSFIRKRGNVVIIHNEKTVHNASSTVTVSGQTSSYFPAKSLTLKFSDEDILKHKIDPYGPEEWPSVYLRNHGLDDLIANRILRDEGIGAQVGRPCVLYINGEYNGIRWFQEKQDKDFIRREYGINSGEIIKFQYRKEDEKRFLHPTGVSHQQRNKLLIDPIWNLKSLSSIDMNSLETADSIGQHFDLTSFLKIRIASAFLNKPVDTDVNTRLFWNSEDNLYREMIKDCDWTLRNFPDHDALALVYAEKRYPFDVMGWCLNLVLKNVKIRGQYINHAADMLATSLNIRNTLAQHSFLFNETILHVDQHLDRWKHIPEMENAINNDFGYSSFFDESAIFLAERPAKVYAHYMQKFEVDTVSVYFNTEIIHSKKCDETFSASLRIGDVRNDINEEWTERVSFTDVPVDLFYSDEAFVNLKINGEPKAINNSIVFKKGQPYYITAKYKCR